MTQKKKKILLVEDENIIALDIQRSLAKLGYTVCAVVRYGEEAVNKTGSLKPDVVLMDITLAGTMNGIEAAKIILNNFNIPVIYLSALPFDNGLQKEKLQEPNRFLTKPYNNYDLQTAIELTLINRAFFNRSSTAHT